MSYIDTYIQTLSDIDNTLEIITDSAACSAYISKNYSRMPVSEPKAILYPVCSDQVLNIVSLANEHKVSLTVRSTQGVESYNGSSLPSEGTECVAVNLSKMNKIMHIDPLNNMAIFDPREDYAADAMMRYSIECSQVLATQNLGGIGFAAFGGRETVETFDPITSNYYEHTLRIKELFDPDNLANMVFV